MRSASLTDGELHPPADSRVVYRLVDPVVGFLVWVVHLVVIYVANAVACGLGLTSGNPGAERALVIALAIFTIVSAAVVAIHGFRRYRRSATSENQAFLFKLAVGQDAIAILAILWQLVPIAMHPLRR